MPSGELAPEVRHCELKSDLLANFWQPVPTGNDGDLALETKSVGGTGFALYGRQAKLLAQSLDAVFCLISHCDAKYELTECCTAVSQLKMEMREMSFCIVEGDASSSSA